MIHPSQDAILSPLVSTLRRAGEDEMLVLLLGKLELRRLHGRITTRLPPAIDASCHTMNQT